MLVLLHGNIEDSLWTTLCFVYNLLTFRLDALVILRLEQLVKTSASCTLNIKLSTKNLYYFIIINSREVTVSIVPSSHSRYLHTFYLVWKTYYGTMLDILMWKHVALFSMWDCTHTNTLRLSLTHAIITHSITQSYHVHTLTLWLIYRYTHTHTMDRESMLSHTHTHTHTHTHKHTHTHTHMHIYTHSHSWFTQEDGFHDAQQCLKDHPSLRDREWVSRICC